MSHAADGNPNVTALVYVASFLAEPGESLVDLVEKFPGAQLGGAALAGSVLHPDGGTAPGLYIDQGSSRRCSPATWTRRWRS